jgi:3D (Asp-Asp-Asp) domain-containing protein
LYGIIEYQNMQASEELALKAQVSATRMEEMTRRMEDLTRKTKKETKSMSAIALVTTVFLPGTFVSVSYARILLVMTQS